jgi:hypothetical protein
MHLRTGLHVTDVLWLYELCHDELMLLRLHKRASKENATALSPHCMLVITIHWLRKYPTFRDLSADCGVTVSNLWRIVRHVVQIMDDCIVDKLIRPVADSAPISTRATLPNVRLIVDTTFIPLPKRPKNTKLYNPKSPTRSAWKFEVGCDLSHRIVNVSNAYDGATHDMRVLRESGLLLQQSATTRIIGDKGYQGQLGIIHPLTKRGKRSRELLALEEEDIKKHELESERSAIENINARIKEWRIISAPHRGGHDFHCFIDQVIRVVCALTNRVLAEHPIRAVSSRA